jgi:hypothetical protein
MMKRLLIILLALQLFLPSLALAQAKAQQPEAQKKPMMCPMMKKMMEGKGMMSEPEKMWRLGAMSLMVSQIMTRVDKILSDGTLKPETQKQLAGVIKELNDVLPEIMSPAGPAKPEDMVSKLNTMQSTLDKMALPAK